MVGFQPPKSGSYIVIYSLYKNGGFRRPMSEIFRHSSPFLVTTWVMTSPANHTEAMFIPRINKPVKTMNLKCPHPRIPVALPVVLTSNPPATTTMINIVSPSNQLNLSAFTEISQLKLSAFTFQLSQFLHVSPPQLLSMWHPPWREWHRGWRPLPRPRPRRNSAGRRCAPLPQR